MLIALTGAPGTGKFTVAPRLKAEGHKVIGDGGPARRRGALVGYDGRTGTGEVDLERLEAAIPTRRPLILGHSSHLLSVDLTIVLRCQPDMLRGRREEGGWATAKVRDNVEAEAVESSPRNPSAVPAPGKSTSPIERPRRRRLPSRASWRTQTEGFGPMQVDGSEVILTWS